MKTQRSQQFRSLLVGGLLPVLAFAWVEDQFGTLWGLVAGMIFGLGEILWEWRTRGKVDALTWGGERNSSGAGKCVSPDSGRNLV